MAAVHAFVVRLWSPSTGPEQELGELRGVVEHLGSGQTAAFKDDAELLSFLHGRSWEREPRARVGETGGAVR